MDTLNLIPAPIPLRELLSKFHDGSYQLPAFQRPFVWKPRQTLNLLDSLHRGYPISVIYLWEPALSTQIRFKKETYKPKGGPKDGSMRRDTFKAYIVDGQQRLTSLHAAFGFSEAFDEKTGRSLECWLELCGRDDREGRITRLFQCPARRQWLADEEAQQQATRVRLRDLLEIPHQELRADRAERLKELGYDQSEIGIALARIDKAYRMLDTPITCITITQANDEEVLQVFNSTARLSF